MQARVPAPVWTGPMVVLGGIAVLAALIVFVRAFPGDPSAFMWTAPSFGAYVGGVVAVAVQPRQIAARRLLAFGVTSSVWIGATVALADAFDRYGSGWWLAPGNVAVQVLGLGMWAAMIALLAAYPDGVYRRPHQRMVSLALPVLAVAIPLGLMLAQATVHPAWVFSWDAGTGTSPPFPDIESPLHVPFLGVLAPVMRAYVDAALVASIFLATLLVAVRYRTLPPEARLAMRWPIYGVGAILIAPLAAGLQAVGALPMSIAQALTVAGLLALPTALAIGLVRPNAFDVDRAMRRSGIYAVVWTAIAAAYVGGAAALGVAAPGEGVQLAIAATIGATLLFEPARRALSSRASRWAYGESVTGEELVRRLGGALQTTFDIPRLAEAVAAVAREGLGARWVRVTVDGSGSVVSGDPGDEEPAAVAALARDDDVFGSIECGPPVRRRRAGAAVLNIGLLGTLARQAALAVHNARLASELRQRVEEIEAASEELAASRSRIVAAHESARRRIERDIHDGAQQDLAALIAGIGVARQQLERDPTAVAKTLDELDEIRTNAGAALENLRQLAGGIHPTVLSDHGLVEAIEMRSAKLPITVTVDCPQTLRARRFGDAVEGAVYFFVSEALANVLKHADATTVTVGLQEDNGRLKVAVRDDGRGFVPGRTNGSGLRGLTDRVEAVGGSVDIFSAVGSGTRVTMTVSVDEPRST